MGKRVVIEQDEAYIRILGMIGQKMYEAQIGKALGIKRQIVSKRLKKLQKEGYIDRGKRGITKELFLLQKGIGLLSARAASHGLPSTIPTTRWHNRWITFKLRQPIDPLIVLETKKIAHKQMPLKNNAGGSFYLNNQNVKLWRKVAVIALPDIEIPLASPLVALLAHIEHLYSFIEELEARTGISLERPEKGALAGQMWKSEIAFTNTEGAKLMIEKGQTIIIYDTPTGEWQVGASTEYGIDFSHDTAEEEFFGIKQYEHSDNYKKNVMQMYRNPDINIGELPEIKRHLGTAAKLIEDYATNIAAHSDAIKKLNEVLDKLDKKLNEE